MNDKVEIERNMKSFFPSTTLLLPAGKELFLIGNLEEINKILEK